MRLKSQHAKKIQKLNCAFCPIVSKVINCLIVKKEGKNQQKLEMLL